MTFHAEVVEAGFHTAVGAAAYSDFEFMRQFHFSPANIIFVMDFLRQALCVEVAVYASGAFACRHRTDFRPCAAEQQTFFCQKSFGGFDVIKMDAGGSLR